MYMPVSGTLEQHKACISWPSTYFFMIQKAILVDSVHFSGFEQQNRHNWLEEWFALGWKAMLWMFWTSQCTFSGFLCWTVGVLLPRCSNSHPSHTQQPFHSATRAETIVICKSRCEQSSGRPIPCPGAIYSTQSLSNTTSNINHFLGGQSSDILTTSSKYKQYWSKIP